MRIVHFSDLHLGVFPPAIFSLPAKCFLGAANYWLHRRRHFRPEMIARLAERLPALAPDLVICTGDLVNISIPEEFALARKQLQPILDWAGERFVYVPGNHDAYVDDPRCQEALEQTFFQLNSGRWQLSELPAILRHGDVVLLLINGARPASFWLSNGSLNETDQARINALLQEPRRPNEIRLGVCHFPVLSSNGNSLGLGWLRGLDGGDSIRRHLQQREIDVLLCGHIHYPFTVTKPNGAIQICPGSLTMKATFAVIDRVPDEPRLHYEYIKLTQ
ncbi:MAG TPA: metallophosphoesterase [Lentisphaeria bacterium]|nr:metallophosphoesterase [Lentisphaeria bacterium]